MTNLFCVLKAPQAHQQNDTQADYMVRGGIYDDLAHAMKRAREEWDGTHHVWIEEHKTNMTFIDVMSKASLVKTIPLV